MEGDDFVFVPMGCQIGSFHGDFHCKNYHKAILGHDFLNVGAIEFPIVGADLGAPPVRPHFLNSQDGGDRCSGTFPERRVGASAQGHDTNFDALLIQS